MSITILLDSLVMQNVHRDNLYCIFCRFLQCLDICHPQNMKEVLLCLNRMPTPSNRPGMSEYLKCKLSKSEILFQ